MKKDNQNVKINIDYHPKKVRNREKERFFISDPPIMPVSHLIPLH